MIWRIEKINQNFSKSACLWLFLAKVQLYKRGDKQLKKDENEEKEIEESNQGEFQDGAPKILRRKKKKSGVESEDPLDFANIPALKG